MLNDIMGMFDNANAEMDDLKTHLNTVIVSAEVQSGLIKISCNANKKITDITIDASLLKDDKKEELEDMLISATNKALQKADKVEKEESKKIATGMLSEFM